MKIDSNANTVILQLKQKLLSDASQEALIKTIAQSVYASNQRRVHNTGKNVNESSIGSYSIKEIYVNPKNSPKKFQPIGKTGKTNFVGGKPHKTKYFREGYKGFRASIGRETGHVNLQLTGKLFNSFQMKKDGSGYVIGFIGKNMAERARGLEKHFGGTLIWGVTNKDKQVINEIVKNWSKK